MGKFESREDDLIGGLMTDCAHEPNGKTSDDVILNVDGVTFAYGGAMAVDHCSFAVARGSVTGLIGPNGAGKSTLLEVINGVLCPESGSVVFYGQNIAGGGAPRGAAAGRARTF